MWTSSSSYSPANSSPPRTSSSPPARAGHTAFERAVLENERRPPTTEDYLEAINETRPTLTPDMVTDFQDDIALYSRL